MHILQELHHSLDHQSLLLLAVVFGLGGDGQLGGSAGGGRGGGASSNGASGSGDPYPGSPPQNSPANGWGNDGENGSGYGGGGGGAGGTGYAGNDPTPAEKGVGGEGLQLPTTFRDPAAAYGFLDLHLEDSGLLAAVVVDHIH